MISREALHTTVGIIGNVISFGLFLSPVKTFYTIYKKKAVEEFIPDPYLATVINCLLWIFYGLPVVHPDSLLVVTINGIGLGLEIIYLIIFMIYGRNNDRKKIVTCVAIELIFLAGVVVTTMLGFHTHDNRSTVVGILCIIFGVIMYASPLTIMKKVVTTKSVEYMPFLLTLTSFLNGLCWLSYALIKFDLYILIANGIGAVLGLVQLILYCIYYFGATPVEEEKKTHVELARAGV